MSFVIHMAITKSPRQHSLFFFISFLGINSNGVSFPTPTKNPCFKKNHKSEFSSIFKYSCSSGSCGKIFLYLSYFVLCTVTLATSKVHENSDFTSESLTLWICSPGFSTIRIMDLIFACDISVSFLHPHNISFLDTHKLTIAALVKIVSLCFWASLY